MNLVLAEAVPEGAGVLGVSQYPSHMGMLMRRLDI
jgi:hypothetical protein